MRDLTKDGVANLFVRDGNYESEVTWVNVLGGQVTFWTVDRMYQGRANEIMQTGVVMQVAKP